MNRRISNRRIDKAQSHITRDTAHCWSTRITGMAAFNWHNDQRSARLARRQNSGWAHGVPASHCVSQPTDPLHTQWLSGTLTPWEYQHLVRRSQAAPQDLEPRERADPSWWLRVASEIEDDFLYRHLAPCGAD